MKKEVMVVGVGVIVVVVGMVEEMKERKVKKLVVEEMKRVAGQGGRLGGWLVRCCRLQLEKKEKMKVRERKVGVYT